MPIDHPFSSAYCEWFVHVGQIDPIAIPIARSPTSLRLQIADFLLDAYRVAGPFATALI
jgi:hypothetical protein